MRKAVFAIFVFRALVTQISCSLMPDSLCGRSTLTETEAKEIAKRRLLAHCKQNKINCALFSEPEIFITDEVPWYIDYTSENTADNRYHFLRITIDHCGRIEQSHQTYNAKR